MSKSKRNYPDPMEVVNKHSADAVRLYLINSPVVKAEPLKFKEEGVKEVVNEVFRPLWNGVKFFVQNYNRFVNSGNKFNPTDVRSSNTMDHWMVANNTELIKYVRGEMEAYRLYTVVPGLLRFLDNLTNWYVRMNRNRLKGTEGVAEWNQSLAVLFEVLSTAILMMAPFTPFLAEDLYQRLKPLMPPGKQEDSVHYLLLPTADETLRDTVILRRIERMQAVIELVRTMREKNKMAIKMPTKRIVVTTSDQEYLDDVESLRPYIIDECHALQLETTPNQTDYVNLSIQADRGALGKRFRQQAASIVTYLTKEISPDGVAKLLADGKLTVSIELSKGKGVEPVELTLEDVKVVREFKEGLQGFDSNTDGKVLVMMDTTIDNEQTEVFVAREFVNRVQTLRKTSGLTPSDTIKVYFEGDEELCKIVTAKLDFINSKLMGVGNISSSSPPEEEKRLGQIETEITKMKLTVAITSA